MPIMLRNKTRRLGVAALAVAAGAAIAVGGAGVANAASGTSNQGARDVIITPNDPSPHFIPDGTEGTLRWNMGDGRPDSVVDWSVQEGDQATYVLTVPDGLTFASVTDDCISQMTGFTFTCTHTADRQEVTLTITADYTGDASALAFDGAVGPEFAVLSHNGEPITGNPTVAFTPFPGLTTQTPLTDGVVVQRFASGTSNQGIRNVFATPTEGAVNFDTPGTPGEVTWNLSDYAPDSVAGWNVVVGDKSEYVITLPEGVEFDSNPPCLVYAFADTVCTLSADNRTYTVEATVHTEIADSNLAFSDANGPVLPITTTGPIAAWNTYANYTPWYTPGSAPLQQITTGEDIANVLPVFEPPVDTPLLAGGIIAVLGLAGAGAVYGIRRHKQSA